MDDAMILLADCYDDLRGQVAPIVLDVLPGAVEYATRERALFAADFEFLAIVAPDLALYRGQLEYAAAQMLAMMQMQPYVPTEDSARGARHLAIAEGVVSPTAPMTAEERHLRTIAKLGYGPYASVA